MSVQSCLNRLNDIDRVVYDSYKCVLNESYKFDTKVDVMCKYERDLDIVYELCGICNEPNVDKQLQMEYNELIHEFNTFENEYIQEGVIDKVKGVFRKIIDLIKRFLSFIGRMLKSLFEKLFKKKLKKTATQVAEEYISVSQVKEYMESGDDNNDNSVKVFFPASKDSKVDSCYVNFIINNLRLKIENGKYIVGVPKGFILYGRSDTKSPVSANVNKIDDGLFDFLFFTNNAFGYRDKMLSIINEFIRIQSIDIYRYQGTDKNTDDNEITNINNKITKLFDELYDIYKIAGKNIDRDGNMVPISPQQIKESTSIVNKYLSRLTNLDSNIKFDDDTLRNNLKRCVFLFNLITSGANYFSQLINHMYLVDAKFLNTVNDLDTLAKVVNGFIDAGIPSNQLAYNIWGVMGKEFDDRGFFFAKDYITNDTIYPRWGQTRVTFFPIKKPNEVLKIALNTAGKFANKSEYQIFKSYKENGLSKFLAEVIDTIDQYTIITMEKLTCCSNFESIDPLFNDNANKLRDNIKSETKDKNLIVPEDIHQNNVGYNDEGIWKLVDYSV